MSGFVYELRVQGDVSDRLPETLTHARVRVQSVVRAGVPDQAALHGLLAWIDTLGVELVDVRPARSPARRSGGKR
jgi:hypothetical protein